jgi:hypothetical protein
MCVEFRTFHVCKHVYPDPPRLQSCYKHHESRLRCPEAEWKRVTRHGGKYCPKCIADRERMAPDTDSFEREASPSPPLSTEHMALIEKWRNDVYDALKDGREKEC